MQHTCLLSVISITTIFPLNLIMRREGDTACQKKGVSNSICLHATPFGGNVCNYSPNHYAALFCFWWLLPYCFLPMKQNIAAEAPLKRCSIRKHYCVSVYIFISFFAGAIKEAYIYAWQKALQHIPHGKGKRSILASSVSGINGAYPQTLKHTFSYASINHFTEVFLLLQFPGNAYLMEYTFAYERNTIRIACLQHKNEPKHKPCSFSEISSKIKSLSKSWMVAS